MPHVLAVAALWIGASTTALTAGAYFWAAVEVIMAVGSFVAYRTAGKFKDNFSGGGFLANTQTSEAPLPVLYGRHRIGGNKVYVSASGDNNKFLHIILTLSEGPIESVEDIYLDDKLIGTYGGLAYSEFFNGSSSQPLCSTLKTSDANWNDYLRFTSYLYIRLEYNKDKFTNIPKITAIVRGRQLYDPRTTATAYSTNPALVWYDFLTNERYGLGVATSAINVQSVIDAANWCEAGDTGIAQAGTVNTITLSAGSSSVDNYYKGKYIRTTGGTGANQSGFCSAYNGTTKVATIDTNWVTTPDATTVYQLDKYTYNGLIGSRQPFLDNLTDMLVNFRGDTVWSEGQYKLLIRKYDSTVMNLTEDDIVKDSFNFTVPGLADTPNRLIVKSANEDSADTNDLGWIPQELVVEDSTAVLTYDNEERDLSMPLIGTTSTVQANLLAIYNLERARLNKVYSFSAHPRTLALEPGDMIQVTHLLPGWVNQVVRVMSVNMSQEGIASLTVQDEASTLYDDILNISPHSFFNTNLPSLLDAPLEVTNVSFTETEYYNKDVSYTQLSVSFTAPTSPFWEYSEVWVSIDGFGYGHHSNVTGNFSIQPASELSTYEFKILSVSIQGVKQDISTATVWTYYVNGKNTPPADVTNFRAIPQADTIVLAWDGVNNLDLMGYEIRSGVSWNSGIFIEFTRAVVSKINGLAPGTHNYMIKSVDTRGVYSNIELLTSATLYGPSSYIDKMTKTDDFADPAAWIASTAYILGDRIIPTVSNGYEYECTTAGTSGATEPGAWPTANGAIQADGTVTWTCYETHVHASTEKYNDPSNGWVLRVTRGGGGNLLGTYTSPVYGRGASLTRRSWAVFDFRFSGTGTVWTDQFTGANIWTDKFTAPDTWLTLFGQFAAGTIKVRLGVSTDGSTWTWYDYFENYVIEAQGNYVKVEISITDIDAAGYAMIKSPWTYKEAYWS